MPPSSTANRAHYSLRKVKLLPQSTTFYSRQRTTTLGGVHRSHSLLRYLIYSILYPSWFIKSRARTFSSMSMTHILEHAKTRMRSSVNTVNFNELRSLFPGAMCLGSSCFESDQWYITWLRNLESERHLLFRCWLLFIFTLHFIDINLSSAWIIKASSSFD